MRKLQLTILLILTLIQNVNSQDKEIKGDTVFWYKNYQKFNKTLGLIDFNTTKNDFSFRFRNLGQVVEIFKTNNQIRGKLTNYIYHSFKKRREVLHKKMELDSIKALKAYEIIQHSGILDLQSDNKIDGWTTGFDGITYIVEHSDKKVYWFKTYWTPSAQDSIPESLTVINFVKALSDALQLSEKYKEFKKDLPRKGCYNSGGSIQVCYKKNIFEFGYFGSTKLPLGFGTFTSLAFISKKLNNFGFVFLYKFDRNDNYDFRFTISKRYLLLNNSKINDYVFYNYQKRELNFVDHNTIFQNHLFNYGLSFKGISLYTGFNYAYDGKKTIGGILGVSKSFYKPNISATLATSIFNDYFDYKIGISKSFHFHKSYVFRSTSIGLSFENFKDYNDFSIYLTLGL